MLFMGDCLESATAPVLKRFKIKGKFEKDVYFLIPLLQAKTEGFVQKESSINSHYFYFF